MNHRMMSRRPHRGLSPLLAIIIGLIIVIVAGILLSQLYFGYASTVSHRPACSVEYVDLVAQPGGSGTLVINLKNTGNVRIVWLWLDGSNIGSCYRYPYTTAYGGNTNIPPGSTGSMRCTITSGITPGTVYTATLRVRFEDDSMQQYSIAARARSL